MYVQNVTSLAVTNIPKIVFRVIKQVVKLVLKVQGANYEFLNNRME